MTVELINKLLTPLIFAVFSTGFFVIWFQYKNLKSAGFFALSYLCGTFAFLFELLLPDNSGLLVLTLRITGDKLYLLITLFFSVAVAYRYSQKVPKALLGFIFMSAATANIWFWLIDDNLVIRSHILSFACALMLLVSAKLVQRENLSLADRILFWLIIVSAALLPLNTIVILHIVGEVLTIGTFWQSSFLALLNFSVALSSLSTAVVLFVGFGGDIIADYRKKSDTDALSNVLNRRGFEESAVIKVNRASDSSMPLTLIVADLDHFKSVNDTHGHDIGDDVIRNFATILKTACRPNDIVGRVGGEEFCILLPNATQEMGAMVGEAIRSSFSRFEHLDSYDEVFLLTTSIGVAELRPGETYLSLFRRADIALYEAKESGRNRICRADKDEGRRIQEFRQKLA